MASIINYIDSTPCVDRIEISSDDISADNIQQIVDSILKNTSIGNFIFSVQTSCYKCVTMGQIFLKNDKLTELYIPNISVKDDDLKSISEALILSKNLITLDISIDENVVDGMDCLIKAMSVNKSLTTFAIYYIGGIYRYIHSLLTDCIHLRTIHLSNCRLDDNDANSIANLLPDNNHLHSLDLSYNYITAVGAAAIANALCYNETLKGLMLDCNEITEDDAPTIETILMSNYTVTHLRLINIHDTYPSITKRNISLARQRRFAKVKPIIV